MIDDPKLWALVTAITFGAAPVVLKMAFQRGGQAGMGILISLALAIPMTLAVALVVSPKLELLTPFAVVAFILGGLAGSAAGRRWNYLSIDLLGASRSATIRSTSPVFTAVIVLFVYQEEITLVRWAAILAIVAGAALVSWAPGSGARGWLTLGVLYAVGAAIAYGLRPIFIKAGLQEVDSPLAATLIGAVAALLYTLVRENLASLRATRLDSAFGFFVIGGVLQAIAQLALALGLSGGDVSLVYSITASAPLFTILLTAILLRGVEEITPRLALGTIAVVVGVIYL